MNSREDVCVQGVEEGEERELGANVIICLRKPLLEWSGTAEKTLNN